MAWLHHNHPSRNRCHRLSLLSLSLQRTHVSEMMDDAKRQQFRQKTAKGDHSVNHAAFWYVVLVECADLLLYAVQRPP
jgi:hypothetical protein